MHANCLNIPNLSINYSTKNASKYLRRLEMGENWQLYQQQNEINKQLQVNYLPRTPKSQTNTKN